MSEQAPEIPELETLELLEYGGEQDLVSAAVQHAQNALPEWTPRESNTELVLIESLALILGVEALAIQMLPGQIVEQLMSLYGITRNEGLATTGKVLFRVTNSAPLQVIPEGTILRYELGDSGETVDFFTLESLTISTAESLSGQVAIMSDEFGPEGNNIPVGAPLDLVTQMSFVDSVSVVEETQGGEGEESDEDFTGRASAVLARSNSTLVLPDNFTAAALSDPAVGRALTLDLHNPAGVPKTPAVGHVTVAVTGKSGGTLTAEAMEAIRIDLSSQALASLSVHVIAPTYTPATITATVTARRGFQADEVKASVEESIRAYLNPDIWDWGAKIDQYSLIGVIYEAPGVATVQAVSPTIQLAGDAPLPGLITVTVTVA